MQGAAASSADSSAAPTREQKRWYRILYVQVLVAMVLGGLLRYLDASLAVEMNAKVLLVMPRVG